MTTSHASLLLGTISEDQHIYLDSLHKVMAKLATEKYLQNWRPKPEMELRSSPMKNSCFC